MVKEAHDKNLKVIVWTVDNKNLALKLISYDIDGVATNKPDLFN